MNWTRTAPGLHEGVDSRGARAFVEARAGFDNEWKACVKGRTRKGYGRTIKACKEAAEKWIADVREENGLHNSNR